MPGRSTLIATLRPSVVTPLCTCAMLAAPTGSGSISANRVSIGWPKLDSIAALICANGTGGSESCKDRRLFAASSPTRSGRVASDWPSLIAAGPMARKAPA
jgi:hypothetical protein